MGRDGPNRGALRARRDVTRPGLVLPRRRQVDLTMDLLTVVDNTVTGIRIVENIVSKGFTCLRNQIVDAAVFRNVVAGVSRARSCY